MRIRTMLTFAAAVLATTAALAQQPPKETPPAPGTPKNFSIPPISKMTLPNGLKVRFVPYGSVPKASVRLVLQTGNVDEAANETWLADLTGEMIQQGTATRSAEDIARQVALMGGSLDVNVGMNQTNIGTDVFSESVTDAIALIGDVARNPKFPAAELDRLKGDLARNLAIQRSQPQPLAQEKFASVTFPNHAYGRYFPTNEMLGGYTLDQVRGFYDRNFGAARAAIYVVGVFDQAAAERAIRTALGDWKAGNPATTVSLSPTSRRSIYLIDRPGSVQSTVIVGLPSITPASNDYVPFVVTNSLLGGSFGSRITSNIREQKGYTYSPSSAINARLGAGTWAETADVTTNVTGPSIKEIIGEIERLRNEPPTAAELQGIQNYLAGSFVLRNSSRAGIVNQLAFLDLYGLTEDYLRTYVQRIYATTPADLQRMAQSYIDPSKLTIVIAGDASKIREQITPYGEIVP
ncbi:MAG TPA: pitrilysin family protein [Thermoanaerobaculia bacterium]|nr:pitrilysin family protein [Thermoanaerobaculia bacterium]